MKEKEIEWFLDDSWENIDGIVTYGFGRVAKANIDMLIQDFRVYSIIDNSSELDKKLYRDIPIINYDIYKDNLQKTERNIKIVITATGRALKSIKESLVKDGKKEFVDFSDLSTFVNEWYLKYKNKLNIGRVAQPITARCTFRCKDCQLLMPYIENPQDDSIETIQQDVDDFFELVDYVADYDIIGGEPFLYPKLEEHIRYLFTTYGDRIGNLQLITNASIIPLPNILKTLKECNIHVRISDYSNTIAYKKRVNDVVQVLKKYEIRYTIFSEMQWTDFGFPYKNKCVGDSMDEKKEHMIECNGGMSRLLHGGRLYFCNPAGGAYEARKFRLEEGDSLEIKPLLSNREYGRRALQLYCMGIMEQGAMGICQYCKGYCGGEEVIAGLQIQ